MSARRLARVVAPRAAVWLGVRSTRWFRCTADPMLPCVQKRFVLGVDCASARLSRATRASVTAALRALYGDMAPKTPTLHEFTKQLKYKLEYSLEIYESAERRAWRARQLLDLVLTQIFGVGLFPCLLMLLQYYDEKSKQNIPFICLRPVPEYSCPFLGITAAVFESTVTEAFSGVSSALVDFGYMGVLTAAGTVTTFFIDIWKAFSKVCEIIRDLINGTPLTAKNSGVNAVDTFDQERLYLVEYEQSWPSYAESDQAWPEHVWYSSSIPIVKTSE